MTQTNSLRLRWFPVLSLLAVCTAGAYAQAPNALPETLPAPALLSVATAEAQATVLAPRPSEDVTFSSSAPDESAATTPESTADSTADSTSATLPEAPSALVERAELPADIFAEGAPDQAPRNQATPNVAPRLTKYIPSGWTAQSLTAHDKVLLGLRDLYSPLNFIAMVASAGYEHVLNGEPNYGTDRGAFGQRLGAAAIRESSQGFFTDSVFSPILREDPRYYVQGSGHNFFYRTVYAATRVVITKTDNGSNSLNGALLLGYASSAALSYTYYPQINKNFHDTVSTFGGSLGGAALGYVVSEFSDDLLKAVHLKK